MQVGKAYLLLAKVYQKGNTVEMQRLAEQALQRSREILSACSTIQVSGTFLHCHLMSASSTSDGPCGQGQCTICLVTS